MSWEKWIIKYIIANLCLSHIINDCNLIKYCLLTLIKFISLVAKNNNMKLLTDQLKYNFARNQKMKISW